MLFISRPRSTRFVPPIFIGATLVALFVAGSWLGRTPSLVAVVLSVIAIFLVYRQYRGQQATRRAYDAASESETRFRLLFDNVNDAVLISDAQTLQILDANKQAEHYLGYSREQLLQLSVSDLYAARNAPDLERVRKQVAESHSEIFEIEHLRADGTLVPVEVSTRYVQQADGEYFISVVRDISERRRVDAALQRSQQDLINSIESIGEGFALWDRDDRLQVFNQRVLEIMPSLAGFLEVGLAFETLLRRIAESDLISAEIGIDRWLAERRRMRREGGQHIEFTTKEGRWIRLAENRTPDGYTVGIYQDITDIKHAEEDIRYRADFDALTALPNRESFMLQLQSVIQMTHRSSALSALLFIDLDRFKNINDTMGHAIGDRLLQEAGQRILASIRGTDTLARFGGDEFTVILRDIDDAMNAARIAESIITRLSEAYHFAEQALYAGASIGITICPNDGSDSETLLRNADMAMYQAKARGRNTYQFFTQSMTASAERFVSIEKDLRSSPPDQDFVLHYQPVIALDESRVLGAEALLRWQHPQRGLVMPGEFIQVAEETQLINDLGAWVLRAACADAQAWEDPLDSLPMRLALNVSSRQFYSGFNAEFVRTVLAEHGFAAERLIVELTESILIDEDERISGVLNGIRDLGVEIAVDDFGTGYSALSYLRRFPVTMLKIDRAFVRDIESNPADADLVESIIAMARALRIRVVAEGVETEGQARLLKNMGCTSAQGYWFGRPVPAEVFAGEFASSVRREPEPGSAGDPDRQSNAADVL